MTMAGEPIAAPVSVENTDAETLSLSGNQESRAIIAESRQRLSGEGGISPAEMRRRLALKDA